MRRPQYYKLDGTTPVAVGEGTEAFLDWARWFGTADRVVKQQDVGPYMVSTIFLGIDHNFQMRDLPILFETMIFSDGGALDYQERCSTWTQALEMHERGVQWAREQRQ